MERITSSNRLLAAPLIVSIVLGLILMSAILPMVKMDPKNIPIGLVVADEGEIGEKLAGRLMENAPELVKFKRFDSVEQLQRAMDDRDVYGALVFPADLSAKIGTMQTDAPEKATIQIYINEGANVTVSTMVQTALTNMVSMIGTQISSQMLGAMKSPVQPGKVRDYANPVQSEIIKVNETGDLGNAPIAFLTVTWFTSLVGGVVLYLAGRKRTFESKVVKLKFNVLQSILPFAYALIAGYVATWYSTWLLGFDLENFNRVALYLALCVAAFTFMIFATLRWLKLPSIAIYILLMFFSMPAVQLAPEMLPAFYRDYIVSWLPIRLYAEGMKEVLFFSEDLINRYSVPMLWVLAVALVLVWVKNLGEKPKTN